MTPKQIISVKIAQKKAGLDDAAYRLVLWNVAGVRSSKELTADGFEDVMAAFEMIHEEGTYWRDRASRRGSFADPRAVWKIRQLHAAYLAAAEEFGIAADKHYQLPGLVRRVSHDRTPAPEQLKPHEAWILIEQLKDITQRMTGEPSSIFSRAQGHSRKAAAPTSRRASTPVASMAGGGACAPALQGADELPF